MKARLSQVSLAKPALAGLAVIAMVMAVMPSVARAADTEVALTIENNRFQPEEIKVKAGAPFVLVITNNDKAPEEFESRELRIEKVIPGGKTIRLKMPALKAGSYGFVGEFHQKTAKGRFIAE